MLATLQQVSPAEIEAGKWALLKIALVFVVMVFLVRRRVHIGYVLLFAAFLLGLALGVGFEPAEPAGVAWAAEGVGRLLGRVARAATLPGSLRLLCLVLTITVFGGVLKRTEKLQALVRALLAFLRDRRWAMAATSSVIGLLPMPGGALVSAPMVGAVAENTDLSPEDKTAINHWMRHVWEYVDPLYPGLLVASSVLAVPVTGLMLAQSPLTVAAIVGGIVFLLRRVPRGQRQVGDEAGARSLRPVLAAVAPVFIVIAAAVLPQALALIATNVPGAVDYLPGGARWSDKAFTHAATELSMLAGLFAVIAGLLAANKVGRAESWQLIRRGVTLKMTALVVGVCVMKGVMADANVGRPIAAYLESLNWPPAAIIGSLVFIVGMLLGYTPGFVAVCYGMLRPMLMVDGALNYPLAAFAYAMGFLGVMLSPTHLCLVLGREHFGARWGGVYARLVAPALVVFITGLVLLLWA